MSFFSRKFGSKKNSPEAGTGSRQARDETLKHLKEFTASRTGCEAFIEPPTRVTQTTMVVVAGTGEWTRRKVPDQDTARKVAQELGVPAFDVNLSGYPSRMREWNQRQRR